MLVKDIMVKEVISLKSEDDLREVAEKFSKNKISGAPVLDDEGNVIGMVSEADIITTLEKNYKEIKMVYLSPALSMVGLSFKDSPTDKETEEIFKDIGDIRVSEMMKGNVKTVDPDADIKVVIDLVASGKINRVPVIKNGKLVGIVTRADIIRGISKTSK
jgi:CBS domain-containing protein